MGINLTQIVLVSAVLSLGSFVYVVGFAPIDESLSPRAGALSRMPTKGQLIATLQRSLADGQLASADGIADKLLKYDPEEPEAYFYRALVDRAMGEDESALANWRLLDSFLRDLHEWPGRYSADELDYFRAWAKLGIGEDAAARGLFGEIADRLVSASTGADGDIRSALALYNIACYRAMAGQREAALGRLSEAIMRGYSEGRGWWSVDPDLESLHADERFWTLGDRIGSRGVVSEPDAGDE